MTIAELDSPQTCPSSIVEMCRVDLQSPDYPRNRLRKHVLLELFYACSDLLVLEP